MSIYEDSSWKEKAAVLCLEETWRAKTPLCLAFTWKAWNYVWVGLWVWLSGVTHDSNCTRAVEENLRMG